MLFLICIHYGGPGSKFRRVEEFDSWNHQSPTKLAMAKLGIISMEEEFLDLVGRNFTSYYQPMAPWVNKLRRLVFPGDSPCMTTRPELYDEIYKLQEAQAEFAKQESLAFEALLSGNRDLTINCMVELKTFRRDVFTVMRISVWVENAMWEVIQITSSRMAL